MKLALTDELIEDVGKIIDPEAWDLPPLIEIENEYHDRNTARDKARAIAELLNSKCEG